MNSAKVETTSKYSSAFRPTRPTFFRSPIEAMPCTMVQKITGAIIILIKLMKASPSHFIDFAVSGATYPSSTPSAMAIRTWIYRTLYQGPRGEAAKVLPANGPDPVTVM